MRFRHRATLVEAEQLLPPDHIPRGVSVGAGITGPVYSVVTMHGEVAAKLGDWILPEPDGERFYPVDAKVFEETYEPAPHAFFGYLEVPMEQVKAATTLEARRNLVERAILALGSSMLEALEADLAQTSIKVSDDLNLSYHAARDRAITDFEVTYLRALMALYGGNFSRAARVAGVDRTTLYRLLERHDLSRLELATAEAHP